MKRHPLRRKIDRLAGRFFIFLAFALIKIIPKGFFYRFTRGLGTLAYHLARKHRKLAIANLKGAFGDSKDEAEYKRIAKEVFRQIALGGCETAITAIYKNIQRVKDEIKIEGLENLREALKRGKGAIALSAHLGNFTLMCTRMSCEDFPFEPVVRYPDDEVVADFFDRMKNILGVKFISARPRHETVKKCVTLLRKNGVVCLMADQSKNKGVFVKFFGRISGTVTGPAVLALRTGAPIVPIFIVRKGRADHTIFIHPALDVPLTGDYDKDIFEITQAFTNIIEDYARRYLEQWWWVHQRWKHSPKENKEKTGGK